MPCYFPIRGFERADGGFSLDRRKSPSGKSMEVACGGCIGCRLSHAIEWTVRNLHEKSLWEYSFFVTLTFDDLHLPDNYSADVEIVQLFHKRLRQYLARHPEWVGATSGADVKVRYYLVSDYGTKNFRPHFHVIYFLNYDFADREPWYSSKMGYRQWISPQLTKLWGQGEVTISLLDEGNATYITRHNVLKVSGPAAVAHYCRIHPLTGEFCAVRPEFMVCSLKPSIGSDWFDKFEGDVFPCDYVVIDGRKFPVPKFYARQLKGRFTSPGSQEVFLPGRFGPELSRLQTVDDFEPVRAKRLLRLDSDDFLANNTPERREVRAEVARLRFSRSDREL